MIQSLDSQISTGCRLPALNKQERKGDREMENTRREVLEDHLTLY